uniref:Uncharacterized protein n=1 Tax=Ananas comosus var. bracteatus TaxID=296719 RepID=A0A6V7PPG6_ANACO|nr:unnamed protein product [Ananas comosus var. bracteatus]
MSPSTTSIKRSHIAGFIGTHTVLQLLNEGFSVHIIDNLDNSITKAVDRVRSLVGPELSRPGTDANLARPEHVIQTPNGQSFPYPPKAHHMYIFLNREKH